MVFIPSTSRAVTTSPKTDAQLRAVIAKLEKSVQADRKDVANLTDLLEVLLAATARLAEADEDILTGEVVRLASLGHIVKAQADALSTADVAGVALEDMSSGTIGEYAGIGIVTKDDWGLTVGADYYLSAATAGAIVTAPDSDTEGAVVIKIGLAVSTEELLVNPSQSILL